ncbi:hypothetical protein A2W24_03225 [Microgenomates group bacterium RBG_16_45_19]|nr:MAG: hypothetical protein A2W24_03225 [Microgenomates group bacterium RBG_16_45_19]
MTKQTLILLGLGLGICLALVGLTLFESFPVTMINPLVPEPSLVPAKPFQAYAFLNLRAAVPQASQIVLEAVLYQDPSFTAYRFAYQTEAKKMTGQLNLPTAATPAAGFPVVLMLRGYVDPAIYQTGIGTQTGAAFFAKNGLATIAPDFLGYGGSDDPDSNVIGERLQKPRHLLDLIASLASLPVLDPTQMVIWAHSNGGQIALSLLEITQKPIPTTLWAPISKPFPYSILYYTDEADDQGKALRAALAEFEQAYDVYDFSIDRYYDQIQAPLLIHQGTADDAVPLAWSQALADTLKSLDLDVTLYPYPGNDHNLRPSWETVIARDLDFFNHPLHRVLTPHSTKN